MNSKGEPERIAAIVREIASGQRQNAGQLAAILERGVQMVLKRHFAGRRDLKRLAKRVVTAIVDGVAGGEVADAGQLGAYARRVTFAIAAEPVPVRGLGARVVALISWRSTSRTAAGRRDEAGRAARIVDNGSDGNSDHEGRRAVIASDG